MRAEYSFMLHPSGEEVVLPSLRSAVQGIDVAPKTIKAIVLFWEVHRSGE